MAGLLKNGKQTDILYAMFYQKKKIKKQIIYLKLS